MPSSYDRKTQRWYILCYTGSHTRAQERLGGIVNLKFYAPKFFIDHQNTGKHDVWSHRSYCFVYGSQDYIYQLKKDELTKFIFMPSRNKENICHPYVSEYDVEQLRKVEQMNGGVIPLILSTEDVKVGDTVEILTGRFKGLTATALTKPGSKYRQTFLAIKNFFTIPLERLVKEDLRIISFSRGSKHIDNFQLTDEDVRLLNLAVKDQYGMTTLSSKEKKETAEALTALIGKCKSINSPTPDTRLRLCIIMAVAYMALAKNDYSGHYINFAGTLTKKNISKSTLLFFSVLRYLCTGFPEHYNDFVTQRKGYARSVSQSLQAFFDTADELWKYSKKAKNYSSGLYEGDANSENWFCIFAPKKKTEAIKFFRDQNITVYAPIVSDGKNQDQKNVLKNLFFVKTTYNALTALCNDNQDTFSILCQSTGSQKRLYIYSDEDIETFNHVNSLDIPGKEILQYSAQEEFSVCRSQRKTITLGQRDVEGYRMTQHSGKKRQEKVVFLLKGVIAIAVALEQ